MRFGIFQSIQLPDPKAEVRYYREALKQVQFAEELGFDSVWLTEHHFSRHGIVSSTLTVLAYLAAVTSSIRLGSAVTVLPFHNPIQVAEEAATVDLLSDGRLDFGAGRGFQWGEYHKLNIPMDEASRRFEESMEVITKVLDDDDRVLKDPKYRIGVAELGTSSVNLTIRPWCQRTDYLSLRLDLQLELKEKLEAAGCSLPYPQQDVHLSGTSE